MTTPISKIILDTDPGGDDIFALLWLLSLVQQGFAELVAVTTTAGNVSAQQTFLNASQVLTTVGFPHIPVGRGATAAQTSAQTLVQADASHIHGSDGMGNLSASLKPAAHAVNQAPSSIDILIHNLNQAPGEITLVAVGPLTNLAAAEATQPGVLQQAKEIVIMAGAFDCAGNVTPQAEFNVWFNPAAVQTVLEAAKDVVVIPLDVTRHLIFTDAMAAQLTQANEGAIASYIRNLCRFLTQTNLAYRETGGCPGFLVHDAATLAYLFYPQTLLLRRAKVQVETTGEYTHGQTIMDRRFSPQTNANAWVAMQVDAVNLLASLIEDLKILVAQSENGHCL
ncbi:MAG: nucleoside hydrolase [Thainema sp.]